MPPKKGATPPQRSASPAKKAPSPAKNAPSPTTAKATTPLDTAVAAKAMSFLRLRSSLTPVDRPSAVPAAPAAALMPTTAKVKPGLLLRRRGPSASSEPATTVTSPGTATTLLAPPTHAPQLAVRNEEDTTTDGAHRQPASVTRHVARNEEEDAQPHAVASTSWVQPSAFGARASADAAKAFTVSTPPQNAMWGNLGRLQTPNPPTSVDDVASGAPALGPPPPLSPSPAVRVTRKGTPLSAATPKGSLSALTQKGVSALKQLRAATTATHAPVPAGAVVAAATPALAPDAVGTAPPPRKVRVLRDVPKEASSAAPLLLIPAPRSASAHKARPTLKRERETDEQARPSSPTLGGLRREMLSAKPTQHQQQKQAGGSPPLGTQRPFPIPAPRSRQTDEEADLPQTAASNPSLASLRAASVLHGGAVSPFRRSRGSGGAHNLATTSPLLQMADAIESRFTARDRGETSPLSLSRSSLHSENLSTPLRVQLHDTRSFVERYQSDLSAPAAQPFRVVGGSSSASSGFSRPSPFARHVTASQADNPTQTVRVGQPEPLMRGLSAVGPVTGGAARSHGRRRSTPAAAPLVAAGTNNSNNKSGAGFSNKPRCVVFDTSSLLESQPGPLNLLMEKWIICIPFTALDELDKIHKDDPSKGISAAARTDREWRKRRAHELRNWITGALKQDNGHIRLQKRMEVVEEYDRKAASNDDSILGFAVFLKRRNENVLFVSEDKFLRIKATSELGNAYAYADIVSMMGMRK